MGNDIYVNDVFTSWYAKSLKRCVNELKVIFFPSTEENCTYFRHFTPGQDAEIFDYKTQKGEFEKLVTSATSISFVLKYFTPTGRPGLYNMKLTPSQFVI